MFRKRRQESRVQHTDATADSESIPQAETPVQEPAESIWASTNTEHTAPTPNAHLVGQLKDTEAVGERQSDAIPDDFINKMMGTSSEPNEH